MAGDYQTVEAAFTDAGHPWSAGFRGNPTCGRGITSLTATGVSVYVVSPADAAVLNVGTGTTWALIIEEGADRHYVSVDCATPERAARGAIAVLAAAGVSPSAQDTPDLIDGGTDGGAGFIGFVTMPPLDPRER